jgi:hypothetical protein
MSEALFLNLFQMSNVKMVDDELNVEAKELMSAAIITVSISPRRPT